MPVDVRVIGLRLVESKPWKDGDRLLASFDCDIAGFRLHGCVLIRSSRGFLIAQPPKGTTGRDQARAIEIVDPDVRAAMRDASHAAFLALGGTEQAA